MTELFSERFGLIQNEENVYSSAFRRSIVTSFFNQYNTLENGNLFGRLQDAMDLFGIEQQPQVHDHATLNYNKEQTLKYFQTCPWNHLFDFAEYVLTLDPKRADALEEKYNRIFRMHGCKYRLVNGKVIPIANDIEIQEISKALHTGVDATDTAYNEAIALLAEKPEPDYNAVIAKTSNALESMVLTIGEKNAISADTLGKAINQLEKKGIVFDQDMKSLIKSIYAVACNAGIRHGGTNPITASEEEAILVLVVSAAAINYLNVLRQQ